METRSREGEQPIDVSDMQRLELRVEGNVQGVGYRDFVRTTARTLGINGWVHNEPDGTVTIYAEATPDTIEEFEGHVLKGPEGVGVRKVASAFKDAEGLPDPFEVR